MKQPADVRALAEGIGLGGVFSESSLAQMELVRYAHGERLCSIGDRLDGMFILASGKLKVYTLLPNGKAMLVRFARPPALIGDVEFMERYPVKNNVESSGESLVLRAGRAALTSEMRDNPAFMEYMVRQLSYKLYTFGNASALNVLYPLENRFASYLASFLADDEGDKYAEEIRAATLTEMADMLGTSYRHLNRVIRRFENEGWIARKRGRLTVLDEDKIRTLAKGQWYE